MSMTSSREPASHPKQSMDGLRLLIVAIPLLVLVSCNAPEVIHSDSEPLSAQIELSTNRMYVGDLFEVQLRIQHPAGGSLRIPELARSREVVVRNESTRQTMLDEKRTITDVDYRLTSFTLGQHLLSTGFIDYVTTDGTSLQVEFPFAAFEVASALGDADEPLRDIKDVVRWPGTVPRWIWGLVLIALLAIIAGWVARHILSKPRTILHHIPPEPAHEVALRRLRALKAKGWLEALNAEPFYVELSCIVRQYIENRFALRAPEMTTEEFIRAAAESRHLNEDQQQLTADFLGQSDLVKFARYTPGRTDMESALQAAERLVLETVPQPAPASKSEPTGGAV